MNPSSRQLYNPQHGTSHSTISGCTTASNVTGDGAFDAPVCWLTFFGEASLLDLQGQRPLPLKYRNGARLLGFLAAHPGRIFRRESLADLFWPELDSSGGRSNLRVVLSDLVNILKSFGLSEALITQREWISFRRLDSLWTDENLLAAINGKKACAAQWLTTARDTIDSNPLWLDVGDAQTSEDFHEWLLVQRAHLENLSRRQAATEEVSTPQPTVQVTASPPVELATLALLRLEIKSAHDCDDERETWRRMQTIEGELLREAQVHGGALVNADLDGYTFAFGHDSLHSGYRYLSLRAAINLHAILAPNYEVHMGVVAGRVLLERNGSLKVSGQRVRLVEQLALGADPGELLTTESYLDLLPGIAGATHCTKQFRGIPKETEIFGQDIGKLPPLLLLPVGDSNTPFFGRSTVINDLESRWRQATQGVTQRYCLEGEPGIGKTRTAYEFASHRQAHGSPVFWIGGRSETTDTPWSALHEMLTRVLSVTATTCSDWETRMDRFFAQSKHALDKRQRNILLGFLATHCVTHGDRAIFAEALRLIICGAFEATLVVIDDAQWVDAASSTVLKEIAAWPSATLFFLTRRPNFSDGVQPHGYHVHAMEPLDDTAARAILGALPDTDLLEKKEQRRIVSSARGLPIYLLAGTARHGNAFAEHLQGMTNGLGEAMRVMKVAALFGMQFELDDLIHLVSLDVVELAIEHAAASRLIVPRSQHTWAFFHPLLHSHLRNLLDSQEKRELAPHAARILAARGEFQRAAALYEEGSEIGLALENYTHAATIALDQEDILAACPLFDHVARLGYGEGEAGQWSRMRHARALVIKDGYGSESVQSISQEVRKALSSLSKGDELAFTATAYAYLGAASEGPHAPLAYAEEMYRLAKTPIQHQTAAWSRANSLFWLGRFIEARPLLESALQAAAALPFDERIRYFPSDPLVLGNGQLAWMCWFMGDNTSAQSYIRQAMEYALASRLRQDMAIAFCLTAALRWSEGDMAGLAINADETWNISDSEEYILWKTIGDLFRSIVRATAGETPNVVHLLAAQESMRQAHPGGLNTGRWLAAAALLESGQNFIALQVIDQALANADQQEHQYCLMDLWRLKAQALAALPLRRKSSIQEAHAQAIQNARTAGARGWLARWYPEASAHTFTDDAYTLVTT